MIPNSIAACIIVKNGSRTIKRLLESMHGAFDCVVVVDTGSTDDTRDIVAEHFATSSPKNTRVTDWLKDGEFRTLRFMVPDAKGLDGSEPDDHYSHVILSKFEWCDDFAKARDYAFRLAADYDWVGFFDADDYLLCKEDGTPHYRQFREIVRSGVCDKAGANAICVGYNYQPGRVLQPTKMRFVRGYGTAWLWEDPIHEELAPQGDRIVYPFTDAPLVVQHDKNDKEVLGSWERNARILKAWYATPGILETKRAKAAYHLGLYAQFCGDDVAAESFWNEASKALYGTSHGVFVLMELCEMYVRQERWREAYESAGLINAATPELKEGPLYLAYIHGRRGDWHRCLAAYTESRTRTGDARVQAERFVVTRGYAPAFAAYASFVTGQQHLTGSILAEVDEALVRNNDDLLGMLTKLNVLRAQQNGLQALKAYVDYLCMDTQAPEALAVLNNPPAAIAHLPEIHDMRAKIQKMLPHLEGWEEYKAAYASIPDEDFRPDDEKRDAMRDLLRVQMFLAWAASLPKEGAPVRVLTVGSHIAAIEEMAMSMNARLHFTLADVAPQASKGLERLRKLFPGRVESHHIQDGHYDWFPLKAVGTFDACTLFEVIEHVPNRDLAMRNLSRALRPGGKVFVSTPSAEKWVESYLISDDPKVAPPFWGHVSAMNYVQFFEEMDTFFRVDKLVEGWDGTQVCEGTLARDCVYKHEYVIVVPSTPCPFDGMTPHEKALGGSEEAVVYLAEALAERGVAVTVFAPIVERPENFLRRAEKGVLYRDIHEWHPYVPSSDARVLFWRWPEALARDARYKDTSYKKLLWLHDFKYGRPAENYAAFDYVLTLSNHHADCLVKCDGADAKNFVRLGNGIVPGNFPPFAENDSLGRVPGSVVYTSSPDRGLETLLDLWPRIRAGFDAGEATLDIYYDWTVFRLLQPEKAKVLDAKIEALRSQGVRFVGGVSQPELHAALRKAVLWAYPHKGNVETFCITAAKMLASGVFPVTTTAGAIDEVLGGFGARINPDAEDFDERFVHETIVALTMMSMRTPSVEGWRAQARENVLARHSWNGVVDRLEEL